MASNDYSPWYKTAHWQRRRATHLAAEPLCRRCLEAGRVEEGRVADHVIPHRGNRRLFDDDSNLQTLCLLHHNEKQREEAGRPKRRPVGVDGYPRGVSKF
jgi:5-methylcytosine-specific restriction protein A